MSDLISLHLTWLRAGGRSPRTIASRERLLHHVDRALPYGLDHAAADELAGYLSHPGWSQWTLHTYFGHLVGFYRWGVRSGYLTLDPTLHLIHPGQGDRLPDPATDDELAQALRDLPAQPWRLAVQLAAWAGLRCCEIVAVRREDVTADWIRIRGKGGRMATVPTSPQLWAVIAPMAAGLLVRSSTGLAMTPQRLTQTQGRVWDRIGQPHQHLHRFRHWFATTLLRNGADIRTVQELMRHASITSTQGYTAVVPAQRQAAVRLLPDLADRSSNPLTLN